MGRRDAAGSATVAAQTSILSGWVRTIARALDARGLPGRDLVIRAGLDPRGLGDPRARYLVSDVGRLWRIAVEATGDPCFGLFVSRFVNMTTFQALACSVLASRTLKEAFERMVRYGRFATDAAGFRLDERGDRYRVAIELHPGAPRPCDEALDAFLALQVRTVRNLSDDHDLSPLAVELERPEPSPSGPFHELFRAPIRFSASESALEFACSPLEASLPTANAELARRSDEVLSHFLAELDQEQVASRVRAAVAQRLGEGEPQEQSVARTLGMSPRTLQRRLADEGTTYHEILNRTREHLACAYIREGWSLTEVAFTLGFADTSSFSRAFKRWTGVAPSEYAGM
jgi:AraC-like DNA-binding protein